MTRFFSIQARDPDSEARLGRIHTGHGVVETPAFLPVGSQGSVKTLTPGDLKEIGTQMILGNAYHLYLRPGLEVIRAAGGLHRFMGWDGGLLTDSGGFQIYSLSGLSRVSDQGVEFRSHIDGSRHFLTPEEAIRVQENLGADVIMVLDDCPGLPAPRERVQRAVERTIRWARRCLEARRRTDQALFGIVQGGLDPNLRAYCLGELVKMPFAGFAIGGLSVGESREEMRRTAALVASDLPPGAPRYLMGVGRPEELVDLVAEGVDLFDCVIPTRNGRNGTLLTSSGPLNIKGNDFRRDFRPVEEGCPCYGCTHFSRAYLRHLFVSKELVSFRLNTLHNLFQYARLMAGIRESLRRGTFGKFRQLIGKSGLRSALASLFGSG